MLPGTPLLAIDDRADAALLLKKLFKINNLVKNW